MKYQGLVELSVRKYLGIIDGVATWEHVKFAIGIKLGDQVYDYKTLEKYNFISRKENGAIDAYSKDVVAGQIYAIDAVNKKLDEINSSWQLNRYIKKANYFSSEYKNCKPNGKLLMRRK